MNKLDIPDTLYAKLRMLRGLLVEQGNEYELRKFDLQLGMLCGTVAPDTLMPAKGYVTAVHPSNSRH